jgi:hypothetical protein
MRRAVSLLAAVLAITGCSGSSKADSGSEASKRTASDTILAQHAVLQLHDLPYGYTEFRVPTSPADRSTERDLLSCLGVPDARGRPGRVEVRGRLFQQTLSSAQIREIASGVVIEPSAADLERPFRVLTSNRAPPCIETYLRSKFTSDPGIAKLHPHGLTVRSSPMAAIGDQRAGFEARAVFSIAGASLDTTYNFFYARRGRAVAQLVVVGLGTVLPSKQAGSLLETVVGRLKGAA